MRKNINLLPAELQKKASVKTQKNLVTLLAALIIGTVVLGFSCFFLWTKYLEYRLTHVEQDIRTVLPQDVLEKRYQEENIKLEEEYTHLEAISKDRIRWANVLQDMNGRLPDKTWITGFTYRQDEKIEISGLTANVADVGAFIYEMHKSKYTSDLSLEWVNEVKVGDIVLNEFALTCTLVKGSE